MRNINLQELKDFAENHTIYEIKEKYGNNGYSLCLKHKFSYCYKTDRKKNVISDIRTQKILKDFNEGLSQAIISKIYNVSRQYISSIIKNANEQL